MFMYLNKSSARSSSFLHQDEPLLQRPSPPPSPHRPYSPSSTAVEPPQTVTEKEAYPPTIRLEDDTEVKPIGTIQIDKEPALLAWFQLMMKILSSFLDLDFN